MKIISIENNRITCEHCKTVFELEPGDVKQEYTSEQMSVFESVFMTFARGGFVAFNYYRTCYVICPICGEKHIINRVEISESEYYNRFNK